MSTSTKALIDKGSVTRRANRSDVALLAGCSKTTVTFVLTGREGIAIPEATRERVRAAARELGYRPNAIAKALTSGKTNTITVVVPNLVVPHYARVLQALEKHSKASGHHLITRTVGQIDFQHQPPDLAAILDGPDDGVILIDLPHILEPGTGEAALAGKAAVPCKPVVSVGIYPATAVDCVEIDLLEGAAAAVDHLLSFEPRRVAFFGFLWPGTMEEVVAQSLTGIGEPRAVAYCQAMKRAGRPYEIILASAQGRAGHMRVLTEYVAAHGCPDAIFCVDDEVAVSAHRAIRELGFELPKDVLLVGCDGSIECEFVEPQVSTIVQPLDQSCAEAWDMLTARLADPTRPIQHARLKARFVPRASSVRPGARLPEENRA